MTNRKSFSQLVDSRPLHSRLIASTAAITSGVVAVRGRPERRAPAEVEIPFYVFFVRHSYIS